MPWLGVESRLLVANSHVSSVFFGWLNLIRFYSLYNILYLKRRIESYSIIGTIIFPNKILLTCASSAASSGILPLPGITSLWVHSQAAKTSG